MSVPHNERMPRRSALGARSCLWTRPVRTFAGALFVGCLLQVCAAARVSETYRTRGEHAKESFEEDGNSSPHGVSTGQLLAKIRKLSVAGFSR